MQMYDFITESTLKQLMIQSRLLVKRSCVVDVPGERGTEVVSSIRTSVESSVFNTPVPKLTKLIEAITGLSVEPQSSSDEYLVASYAFGGHYECHMDAVRLLLYFILKWS